MASTRVPRQQVLRVGFGVLGVFGSVSGDRFGSGVGMYCFMLVSLLIFYSFMVSCIICVNPMRYTLQKVLLLFSIYFHFIFILCRYTDTTLRY